MAGDRAMRPITNLVKMSNPVAFSPAIIIELQLDQPDMLRMIAADAVEELRASTPLHVMLTPLLRYLRRPTPAQRTIEADADILAESYGLWHGQRIASVCGALKVSEADRTPDAWRRIAHELSWRMGCEERRTVGRIFNYK